MNITTTKKHRNSSIWSGIPFAFLCLWQSQNVFLGLTWLCRFVGDAKVSVFSQKIKLGGSSGRMGLVSEPILPRYISQHSLHITFTTFATHNLHNKGRPSTPRKDRKGGGMGKLRRKHELADLKEFCNLVKCGGKKIGVELWSWKDTELSWE